MITIYSNSRMIIQYLIKTRIINISWTEYPNAYRTRKYIKSVFKIKVCYWKNLKYKKWKTIIILGVIMWDSIMQIKIS